MKKFFPLILSTLLIASFFRTYSQQGREITDMILYRSLGPYRCGSWISAIAGPLTKNPEYKYTWYVAGRNGGVWKTVNNGTTFFPVFDSTGVSSIGAIAVSPSNPEIVWVGTGEAFNARSSHAGKGIFKSEDGGKTWRNMGLEDSQHISQVIVHPGNPDVIWVAVMGHLFTPNKMRGVYKTNNGGENWEKVLFIDENTGIIDLIINPQNPDVLFAAAYEKSVIPGITKQEEEIVPFTIQMMVETSGKNYTTGFPKANWEESGWHCVIRSPKRCMLSSKT
jgi:hypothetical protein